MSDHRTGRFSTFILLVFALKLICAQYEVPKVTIQALKPRGFRASIPDAPNVTLFVFQGNINREIGRNDVGQIAGEVLQPKDGRWTFQDPNLELKIGDVVNYYVVVSKDRAGYIKDNLSFKVNSLEDQTSTNVGPEICHPTVTTLRGGGACAGQVIFEDNFDEFNENAWQIEQFIPLNLPGYPFVSYQRLTYEAETEDPTVSVSGGNLRITPKLQQELRGYNEVSIYNGSLNLLNGCTGETCMKQSWGADILPPIVSGRVTSKGFAFNYGTVTVRAKLPQGDWLYPEIFLEPFFKKYGNLHYASGLIKIASARGNRELSSGTTDYSNKVLYGGAVMDFQCPDVLLSKTELQDGRLWGDSFREYSVSWTPDYISLSVDGAQWARIEPKAGGLRGHFPGSCRELPSSLLSMGSKMAPFDDFFYLTLGVGAGGVIDFPDGVRTTGGRPKPWTNRGSKALLNFWQDMASWRATWNQPQLLVDYVKVVAL